MLLVHHDSRQTNEDKRIFTGYLHELLSRIAGHFLMGHRRLLSKSCILFYFCYEKVILNYYPGCKRRNAGLKSPNTPTHLEVLRNGGAKVNAELAAYNPSAAKTDVHILSKTATIVCV